MSYDAAIYRTKNLTTWFLVALALIAMLNISAYTLIRITLYKQASDSLLINLSGRQRMLSQKLTKEVLLLVQSQTPVMREKYRNLLSATLSNWSQVHNGLQHGDEKLKLPGNNSHEVLKLFAEIEPHYQIIKNSVDTILAIPTSVFDGLANNSSKVHDLVEASPLYLKWMDQTVFQYDKEARTHVDQLERFETTILIIILFILGLESIFIFRPVVNKVRKSYQNLQEINSQLTQEIADRKQTRRALQKSHDELENRVEERTMELEKANVALRSEISEHKHAEKKLLNYQQKLRSLASDQALTEESQRRRFATDLHDSIGQTLAISKMKLSEIPNSGNLDECRSQITEVQRLLEQSMQDTRNLTFELSPPILYELGLEPAVEWLTERFFEQHNINISFNDDGRVKPLDNDVRIVLFRSVRELLINIVKHASAKEVFVSIKKENNHIKISISDDGIGFDVPRIESKVDKSIGFGFFSIRERLEYLGGLLEINSKQGKGTRIVLSGLLKDEVEKGRL